MSKLQELPGVSVLRFGHGTEQSFRADQVEHASLGPKGRVTLLGGPTYYGKVTELARGRSLTLGDFYTPNPDDRNPEQLKRRDELGKNLQKIAKEAEPELTAEL